MSTRIGCVCPGAPDAPNPKPCPAHATQEDLLCDHCRTIHCPERTSSELDQPLFCVRLGCPEHTIPGSAPLTTTAVF